MLDKDILISNPIRFDHTAPTLAKFTPFGDDWPTVYIINNSQEVYIGETTNIATRLAQHLDNPDRRDLHEVRLISGNTFNKSVALDLEAFLISHISADNKFRLQNGNSGQQNHNYYQKAEYEAQFRQVWKQLQELGLANRGLKEIENSNLFKYSPYKALTADQYEIISNIIKSIADNFDQSSTYIVNGGPGTGKTILGIYLLSLLASNIADIDNDDSNLVSSLQRLHRERPKLNIGMVISMSNLRNIVQEVFSGVNGLSAKMVYSPSQIAHSDTDFDLLIVDEAHRLRQRKNLAQFALHDKANRALGLGDGGTELDWIMKKSRHQVLLYDQQQSIRKSDVDRERFTVLAEQPNCHQFQLTTQVRCNLGGSAYIEYIENLFSNSSQITEPRNFPGYDFKLFDDVMEMVTNIKSKEQQLGLCRVVAGYAWKWNTKGKLHPAPKDSAETQAYINQGFYDIEIDGHRFLWNTKYDGWLSSPNSINEIGCIHTIQGFDLNYAGIIIGNDLKYSPSSGFYVDKDQYYDIWGKYGISNDELLQYVLNIYRVLCTRGMYGTYIYACDPGVREYLKKYIPTAGCKQDHHRDATKA